MATTKRTPTAPTEQDAALLLSQLHALGDFAHVNIRAERGHLLVAPDDEPIARLTPLAGGQFGLSFHRHDGRWEPMPFAGDLSQQAKNLVTVLGMYLARYEFTDSNSGSDH